MSIEKNITIVDSGVEYTFVIQTHPVPKLLLIVERQAGAKSESIVSLNNVPDKVQIKFYLSIQNLNAHT